MRETSEEAVSDEEARAADLGSSRQLDLDRMALSEDGRAAIEHLLERLEADEGRKRKRRADDRHRLRATLEAIVLDLYALAKARPGDWLAYSRNKTSYTEKSRYQTPAASQRTVTASADFLTRAGLAEHAPGYYERIPFATMTAGRGYRSRLRTTSALIGLLEDKYGLRPADVGFRPGAEVVRLKGKARGRTGPKPLLEYVDTDETNHMRESLRRINALLQEAELSLDEAAVAAAHGAHEDDAVELQNEERPFAGDFSARRLYRVFNNGSWKEGGRFYGGWWMAVHKAMRPHILIDGEPTIELDFKGLHPRLCYHMAGRPLAEESDPYAVANYPRDLVKKAFNQLLNSTPEMRLRAPAGADKALKGAPYRNLLAAVQEAHRPIQDWFRAGRGLRLQNWDSRIAKKVLDFLSRRGIVALPVHDSFIVQRRHERVLGETMSLAYRGLVSTLTDRPALPVIRGWSSRAVEEDVQGRLLDAEGRP